ncbi:MAG: pseudouridine synthase [Chthoniobacterales bacterium]|nr:pseudouridine synthase [Chthoniobacterales bacterium]
MLLALNKPHGVLSQFTPDHPGQRTLAEFGFPRGVYPLGRLDRDSEGLLLLTDEPGLNTRLLDPRHAHPRTYWAQVEGTINEPALQILRSGVVIEGQRTLPAKATTIAPDLPPRIPPIRFRKNVPTSWIELELTEGRNRQVRKMTAAAGFPTLRLVRVRIGRFKLPASLAPGQWRELDIDERNAVFA